MKFYIRKNDTNDFKLNIIDNINILMAENQGISDMEITINTKRTGKQNNGLHLYFDLVAQAFNESGLDFTMFFKKEWSIIVTPDIVKENIWKPLQKIMFGTTRTRDLKKQSEIDAIYDVTNKKLSEFGISVEFPNKDFEEK